MHHKMEADVNCALCNSLGSNDGNLVLNTEEAKKDHARIHFTQSKILDDEITEGEILLRCLMIRQPKVERPSLSLLECRRSLLNLCKTILKDQPKAATAICNVCGFGLKTIPCNMVNHACAHLEIKLFKCRLCNRTSSDAGSIPYHIRRDHEREPNNEDIEDKTVEHLDDISKRIKRCFSSSYPRASELQRQFVVRKDRRDQNQRSIADLCRAIFIQRSKPTSFGCNLCGLRINFRQGNKRRFEASAMYFHAAAHLESKLFTCRHCDQPVSTIGAIKTHLKNAHQIIDGNDANFDDHSESLHAEYSNVIERCFSANQIKLEMPPVENQASFKLETSIRKSVNGSKLAADRYVLCNRLIRKAVDSDAKVQCFLCPKRLVVMTRGRTESKYAFLHAETHLRKPLYRCKVCRSSFNTKPTVENHLKTKHALGMKNNHECLSDEYHEEFMAILSKCYDAEGSKTT